MGAGMKCFFVTQYTRWLKYEIRGMVESQDPSTVDKAAALAKIQQQVLARGKSKMAKASSPGWTTPHW